MARRLGGDQVIEAKSANGCKDGFNMAMRFGDDNAEQFLGRSELFALEGAADDVKEA